MKIKIHSIIPTPQNAGLMFIPYNEMVKRTNNPICDKSRYKCVFQGEVPYETLENVVRYSLYFKGKQPICVSDIIEVVSSEIIKEGFYYFNGDRYIKVDFVDCSEKYTGTSTENMTVLVIEPGKYPERRNIPANIDDFKRIIGGEITVLYPPFEDNIALVCATNACGNLNRTINTSLETRSVIAGNFILCGYTSNGEELTELSPEMIEKYSKLFFYPEQIFIKNGKICSLKYKV